MGGATREQLEEVRGQFRERRAKATFEVWPENWRAFELFAAMRTQWIKRTLPDGSVRFDGLNYQALDSVESRMPPDPAIEVPDPRTLFAQLRLLEDEALDHLNPLMG